ncbi:MAG: MATE family efflux transporter [Acidimicrobiales bacterium]|nr:MATE family efflux transporter [Acidimicrobiales bacterium]MDG2217992.1 MATE family efflux transporter [Acidimicrobiales bacterium]
MLSALRSRWTDTDSEILRLAFPALGALTAEPLYVLADTAVVGHLGTPELGGLALASSLILIAFAVFIFLAYGTTAAVARLLGAGQHREAAHQAVQSIWLAAVVGVVIAVVGLLLAEPLVDIMGGEGAVRTHALTYFRISMAAIPPMLMGLAGVGYLRGLQDTKRPFIVAIVTALLNLVLELVLIYGFDYGIGASAFSTVIAHWVSAGIFCWWIANAVAKHGVSLLPDRRTISKLAGAGVDLLLRTTAMRAGLLITLAVAARIGTDDLAAHEIAFQLWSILALSLDAVAIAAQAMIGRALGSGDAELARQLGRRMIQWGWWAGVLLGAVVLVTSPVVPSIFSNDPAVTGLAAFLLIHVAVWQPLNGIVFALDGILIGAGDLRFLAYGMWLASVVLIAGAFGVLAFGLGIGWLWGALGAWMVVRAGLLIWRFQTEAWQVTGAVR